MFDTASTLTTMLEMLELRARRSGRTERMVAQLRSGHRVVCATQAEARRLEHELRARKIEGVRVTFSNPAEDPRESFNLMSARMPTVFTHEWQHGYWIERIRQAGCGLEDASGHIQGKHLGLPQWPSITSPDPDERAFATAAHLFGSREG